MSIFKKKYVQQSSMENIIVTNPRTNHAEVFDEGDFILAVDKNRIEGKTAHCYLVVFTTTFENGAGIVKRLAVTSPRYSKTAHYPDTFESLYEIQGVFDVYSFSDFANLDAFRKEHGYKWGDK